MDASDVAAPQQPPLLEQLREKICFKHYSIRTEDAYVDWVRSFILFHGKRHPAERRAKGVEAFLTQLAVKGKRRGFHPEPGQERPVVRLPAGA